MAAGEVSMKGWNIFKVVFVSLVLLLLYLEVSQPNVYMKLWFAVLWGIIAIITILRTETMDWLSNETNLRLPQAMQLAFALLLVLAAAVATDWANLSRRDLLQWAYALFALPAYRQGFIWARSHFPHV
jgi:hypothetical protein